MFIYTVRFKKKIRIKTRIELTLIISNTQYYSIVSNTSSYSHPYLVGTHLANKQIILAAIHLGFNK